MTTNGNTLPPHTCYVQVWPDYERLFKKRPSLVEICNDHGAISSLFHLVRDDPQAFLSTAIASSPPSDELVTYHRIVAAWCASQGNTSTFRVPTSIEELRATLLGPYQRLHTVLFEDLDWRNCLERYNDPRAVLILSPPWTEEERDEWAVLQLRLRRARFQWKLIASALTQPILDRMLLSGQESSGLSELSGSSYNPT